jgi:predicted O-methyltransferase YrrM
MDRAGLAADFAASQPGRFDDLLEELATVSTVDVVASGYYPAFVAAARASYVLSLGDGLVYAALRVAEGFGTVGRLDLVIRDPALATIVESGLVSHDLSEAVHIHRGLPAQIVPGINGPYDIVMADMAPAQVLDLFEPIVRLLRTGGSVVLAPWDRSSAESGEVPGEAALLQRLAEDARLLAHLPATESPLITVRRR